jgi:integrase
MPTARNTLREWKLACPKTEGDLVFPNGAGNILRTPGVHQQCWRPLLRALGLEDSDGPRFRFHSLRHVAASLMIESGMSPKKIQTIMGHASIGQTFDTYGHLFASPDGDAAAMEQAEKRLFS